MWKACIKTAITNYFSLKAGWLKLESQKVSQTWHLTCVDELDMPLQVAVDHENLVAARVRARSLPHLLVMFLDVFLKSQQTGTQSVVYTDEGRARLLSFILTAFSQGQFILNGNNSLLIFNLWYYYQSATINLICFYFIHTYLIHFTLKLAVNRPLTALCSGIVSPCWKQLNNI